MRKSVVVQLFISLAILLYMPIFGQSGLNDDTFNPDDIGFGYGTGPNGAVYTSLLQSDGKILIGGILTEYDNALSPCIARINPDGSKDANFLIGDGASGSNASVQALLVQPDLKILVAGSFQTFNALEYNSIVRLHSNGSLDGSFRPQLGQGSVILSMALQPDGKVLIGGTIYDNNAALRHLARLNTNGSLDTTFKIGAGPDEKVLSIAVQADSKIVVAGEFTTMGSLKCNYIVRLLDDGTVDTSFVIGSGPDKRVTTIALQKDGKLVLAGDFVSYMGAARGRIARILPDGSLDETFGLSTGANNTIHALYIHDDGRMTLGGSFTSVNNKNMNYLSRLNSEGSLDPTFNVAVGPNNVINTLAVQSDARTVIGGAFTTYNNVSRSYIARVNANGSLNLPFNQGTGASLTVNTASLQSDGKVVIGGSFTSYNGAVKNRVMRLHTDGKVDVTFNIGTGADATIYTSLIQPDGKVVIAGDFTKYNEQKSNSLARINTSGSIDTSFHIGTGPRKNVSSLQVKVVLASALQKDGKILIGGQFVTYNGADRKYLARINPDGTLDATFKIGVGPNDYVDAIAIQTDGKIIVAGNFTFFNGVKVNRIVRLHTDGALDASFAPISGPNALILCTAIQSDGKILVGGDFSSFNAMPCGHMVRLKSNGSVDSSFAMNEEGATGSVHVIALQSDRKIIIGGNFYSYNGKDRRGIARLDSVGGLDENFNPEGTGANNTVFCVAVQKDDKAVIAGNFTAYNGVGRNRIARISLKGEDTHVEDHTLDTYLHPYPNPTTGEVNLHLPQGKYEMKILDEIGTVVYTHQIQSFGAFKMDLPSPKGVYFVHFKDFQGHTGVVKVLKR